MRPMIMRREHQESGRSDASGHAPERSRGPLAQALSRGRVRILRNPRSRRNLGREPGTGWPGIEVVAPPRRSDTAAALAHCHAAGTDCLIIDGGDGTIRDVLTAGAAVFGSAWPALAVLPRGKTNALANDLRLPRHWGVPEVLAAVRAEQTVLRHPLLLQRVGAPADTVLGFIVGAGTFASGIEAAQSAHQMGMFGDLAVGATLAWSVVRVIAGRGNTAWREGSGMTVTLPGGERLVHRGGGDTNRRSLLVATTLRRLPLGLRPFGPERAGLKLLVVDRASRAIYAAAPLLLAGALPGWLTARGVHRLDPGEVELICDSAIVLDGDILPPGHWRISTGPALEFVAG